MRKIYMYPMKQALHDWTTLQTKKQTKNKQKTNKKQKKKNKQKTCLRKNLFGKIKNCWNS